MRNLPLDKLARSQHSCVVDHFRYTPGLSPDAGDLGDVGADGVPQPCILHSDDELLTNAYLYSRD